MRRLIAYLNHLFLGVILGMIFVTIAHSCPSQWLQKVRATRISIRYDKICALKNWEVCSRCVR
jgi:hypothetical protein